MEDKSEDLKLANDIIKSKISDLKTDIKKLDDVEGLIGAHAIINKKNTLLDCVFALQDVQDTLITVIEDRVKHRQSIELHKKMLDT